MTAVAPLETIRDATLGDVPGIAAASVAAARFEHDAMQAQHGCDQPDDVEGTAAWFRDSFDRLSARHAFLIAELDGAIVGFVAGVPLAPIPQLITYLGEVEALGVLPNFHGHGIGTRLLNTVGRHLLHAGLNPVAVWTWAGSPAAGFYLHRGAAGPLAYRGRPCSRNAGPFEQVAYGWPNTAALLAATA